MRFPCKPSILVCAIFFLNVFPRSTQILTHVREKLQFIEKENAALAAQLSALEAELAEKRDRLGRVKAERDTLRAKGRKIKESGSNITGPQLLDDIEVRTELLAAKLCIDVPTRCPLLEIIYRI